MADILKSFSNNQVPTSGQLVTTQKVMDVDIPQTSREAAEPDHTRPLTEELRKRLALEQEKTKQCALQLPASLPPVRVTTRSAPPGYADAPRRDTHSGNATPTATYRTAHTAVFNNFQPPAIRTHWEDFYRQYEQEMRTEFLKSITKGPHLDFPSFDGDNPGGWIRQCDKFFQMSGTPNEYKVNLAQMQVVGKADVWLRRLGILANKTNMVSILH